MKVIVCYNPKNHSHAIINSAMREILKSEYEFSIEDFNIDKRNLIKYLNKLNKNNELPVAIYIYKKNNVMHIEKYNAMFENYIKTINESYPEIPVVIYENSVSKRGMYKTGMAPTVKSNKKKYCLLDKIELDMNNEFEEIPVFKVDLCKYKIKKEIRSAFDIHHAKGNMHNCYLSELEAIDKIKKHLAWEESLYHDKINRLQNEMNEAKLQLKEKKMSTKEIINSLNKKNKA